MYDKGSLTYNVHQKIEFFDRLLPLDKKIELIANDHKVKRSTSTKTYPKTTLHVPNNPQTFSNLKKIIFILFHFLSHFQSNNKTHKSSEKKIK